MFMISKTKKKSFYEIFWHWKELDWRMKELILLTFGLPCI